MGYLLKEEMAYAIRTTYKNSYIIDKLDLSATYISIILHRKKPIAKHMAFAFTKALDNNAEIEDYFELK